MARNVLTFHQENELGWGWGAGPEALISKVLSRSSVFQAQLLSTALWEGAGVWGAEVTGQNMSGRESTVLEERGSWDNHTPKHQSQFLPPW